MVLENDLVDSCKPGDDVNIWYDMFEYPFICLYSVTVSGLFIAICTLVYHMVEHLLVSSFRYLSAYFLNIVNPLLETSI